jgi:hypothetical protein
MFYRWLFKAIAAVAAILHKRLVSFAIAVREVQSRFLYVTD